MTDKTYIVNDQPTDTDALDFTPYVQTLADISAKAFKCSTLCTLPVPRAQKRTCFCQPMTAC